MNGTYEYLDKAIGIHRKHGLREINISALSERSMSDAIKAAEHLYDDMVANSHIYTEHREVLKLLETFPPEDKAKAVGIMFNLIEECKLPIGLCPVKTVVEVSDKWSLKGDSFNTLIETLFD